jgi:phosphate:Na+ symporter
VQKFILSFAVVIFLILIYTSPEISNIAAGVAILLFGMIFLEDGFKYLSTGPLQRWIRQATDNLFKSISFGLISTSVLQSSGLISVISISFLSAGLIDLSSGIGIIFGSNIGTTTGAWLIALFGLKLKISSFALPILVFGIIFVLQSDKRAKGFGYVLAGIGFLFLGIHYMKEGFETFQYSIDLKEYSIPGFWGLITFTALGLAATVIMQSSHASLAIILSALSTNQITYMNALAMTIGANIGTTVMAIIGSINSTTEGKRLAGAHFIFNLGTGIIALIFLTQFGIAVDYLSNLVNIGTTEYILKLSLFHTLFNVTGVIVMIPFIPAMIKLLNKIIKTGKIYDISQPKYLSKSVLKHPGSAVPAFIKESRHLLNNAFEIIAHSINLHRVDIFSDKKLKELIPGSTKDMAIDIDEIYYKKIKLIYGTIIQYATIIQSFQLRIEDAKVLNQVRVANRYVIEIIKNMRTIQKNMSKYSRSNNENIRVEYNLLRLKIAKVIREINRSELPGNITEQYEKLKKLRDKAKSHDVLVNGRLDNLIREHKIDSDMATSLMNDSALVALSCERLITVAELLYFKCDTILDNVHTNTGNNLNDFFDENSL